MKKSKLFAAVLAATLTFGAAADDTSAATRAELSQISVNQKGSNFKYWNKNAQSYQKLVSYVKDVTDKKSKNYIPPADRIAVFDLDGTLVCETTPSYFEWMLYLERALNDSNYRPPTEEKEYAQAVRDYIINHKPLPGKDNDRREAKSQEAVFADLTLDEYEDYVKKFMETPAEGLTNLKRGDSFYLPMVEVVSYLNANKFKTFVVSGSDRQTVRILVDGALPIDTDNIIGTDSWYHAANQGDTDGLSYLYSSKDKVVRGEFVYKNLKMNKVTSIVRDIGKQPVLAFGNSSGDFSMFNYTLFGNKYKSMAFSLLCDDLERELGNMKKADAMRADCEKNGYVPVSMRDDFATIYGDNVKRADGK